MDALFWPISNSLGGRLRYLLVSDRCLDSRVKQFLQVCFSASVLQVTDPLSLHASPHTLTAHHTTQSLQHEGREGSMVRGVGG